MVSYLLSTTAWGGPVIDVCDYDGTQIAVFPEAFVRQGGDDTWHFVLTCVKQLIQVEETADLALVDLEENVMQPASSPQEGHYRLKDRSVERQPPVRFAPGPEYHSRTRAPKPYGTDSSYSRSSQISSSRHDQAEFRDGLLSRDGRCLITGARYTRDTPAHIVPVSRPDIYQRSINVANDAAMYTEECGLLLRMDVHKAFDKLYVSFHVKDGNLIVHVFINDDHMFDGLHGKVIPRSYFRCEDSEFPCPRLLAWHYEQCLKAHIRGFSVQMGSPRTLDYEEISHTNMP